MRLSSLAAIILGCAMFLAAQRLPTSDLKIVTRFTGGGMSSMDTKYISGQRSRTESIDTEYRATWRGGPQVQIFGHPRAVIYQCDQHQLLTLDLLTHEYSTSAIDDNGLPSPHAPPIRTKPSGGTLTVTIETVDTGERKMMFGHVARHVITKQSLVPGPGAISFGGQQEQDGWYIDLDAYTGCRKSSGPIRYSGAVLVGASSPNRDDAMTMDKMEWKFIGTPAEGFPVEVKSGSWLSGPDGAKFIPENKSEITELSTAPLDPALFDVPSGFKKVDHLNFQLPNSFSSQLQVLWYMVKQRLSEIF